MRQQQQQQQQQQGVQLLLYDNPHSAYTAKVKVALHYKGLAFEKVLAKPCGRGGALHLDFRGKVPLGKIPALVVRSVGTEAAAAAADGTGPTAVQSARGQEFVLYESEVTNEWLEEQFPQPPLMPAHPLQRSKARLISCFHDLYLKPALRKLCPHVAPTTRDPAAVAAAAAQHFNARLAQLESTLQPQAPCNNVIATTNPLLSSTSSSGDAAAGSYAVGDSLTLADCGYPALLLYAELIFPVLGLGQLDFAALPRIWQWREVLWRDPSVVSVLQELQPAAERWVESQLHQTQM